MIRMRQRKHCRKSSSDLVMVLEAGFDNNLRHTGKARVQLIADATDPNNATILTSYASNIIADYQQSRIMATTITHTDYPPNKVICTIRVCKVPTILCRE